MRVFACVCVCFRAWWGFQSASLPEDYMIFIFSRGFTLQLLEPHRARMRIIHRNPRGHTIRYADFHAVTCAHVLLAVLYGCLRAVITRIAAEHPAGSIMYEPA